MHNDNKIDEHSSFPIITLDYKDNKTAVDRVDQLCHNYNVQKRTKLLPLAYFLNCLNIAGINSMVIFRAKLPQSEKVSYRRQIFLESLAMSLLHSRLQRQVRVKQLPKHTKLSLRKYEYKIDIGTFQSAAY